MGDTDVNLSARRGELEGVGENIDDDLVEVATVNPYGQLLCIMLVREGYLLAARLMLKQGVDVLHECDEVGLLHVHLHHALVDLPEVHHLVDEVQDALGISLDGLVDTPSLRIVVLLDE